MANANRVLFISCTQQEYKALKSKDSSVVYWLSDAKQIYKGEDLYSNDVIFAETAPSFETAEDGKLYVVKAADGKVQLITKGATAMVPAGGEVSTKDVEDKIAAALKPYNGALVSVASKRSEDNSGTVITFTDHTGKETPITIADLFLSAAEYDTETHHLKLTVTGTDTPVEVDLSELVPQAVNTSQVAIAKNIVATVDVGNIKKGQKIDVTDTQNVQQLLEAMLSQDSNPTVTQPRAAIVLTGAGAKEVGSKFTPAYTVTFDPGKYSDTAEGAQATNVVANGYAVTDTASHEASTASGAFAEFTVEDDTNYSVSAVVTHSEGAVPKTYLGKEYAAGKIAAGTKSAKSGSVTGYRQGFYGSLSAKDAAVDSALVRGLSGRTNKKVAKGQKYTVQVPAGTLRVVVAYDASIGAIASITSAEQFNSEIKDSFTLQTVQVNDASGANPKAYNVYVKDMAGAQASGTTYTVTI